jgi:hypothetical protein
MLAVPLRRTRLIRTDWLGKSVALHLPAGRLRTRNFNTDELVHCGSDNKNRNIEVEQVVHLKLRNRNSRGDQIWH